MKLQFVAVALASVLATGCAQRGLAVYVAPQTITAQTVTQTVPKHGPLDVRLTVESIYNGERIDDSKTPVPFAPYAKKAIDALKAFQVVDRADAPELKLTLSSTIDLAKAKEQGLKSAVTVGFADASFRRDFSLKAELNGVGSQALSASNSEHYMVSTRREHAPAGSTPLGAREGYEALYDALIYPTIDRLIRQM